MTIVDIGKEIETITVKDVPAPAQEPIEAPVPSEPVEAPAQPEKVPA